MKYLNPKKEHISGQYKYCQVLSDDLEFIKVLEDGDFDLDGNKLTYKDGCWRLGKVKREIWNGEWGDPKTVFFPIEYKSEGSPPKKFINYLFLL